MTAPCRVSQSYVGFFGDPSEERMKPTCGGRPARYWPGLILIEFASGLLGMSFDTRLTVLRIPIPVEEGYGDLSAVARSSL